MRRLRVLGLLAVLWCLPLLVAQIPATRSAFVAFVGGLRDGSPASLALFVIVAAIGAVLTAPIALFAGIAGYVHGPVRGVLLASPSSAIAATAAFLVGRFLLSARVSRWAAASPRWEA